MTPAQWTATQAAVAALNNPAASAFVARGTNVIPAAGMTLPTIVAGVNTALTAEIVTLQAEIASLKAAST